VKKGSKIYSVLHHVCPNCQEGKLFLVQNPYDLKQFDKMHDKCPVCGEDFVRESGFYYGAMMISHALTTIIAVIVHVTCYIFEGWDHIWRSIIITILVILVMLPITFRLSRGIWLNIFVKYHSNLGNKNKV
jgi:uncharacterized protein (DUF983 family)